jgi:hypothetical protein
MIEMDLTNEPVAMKLAGREVHVRRLTTIQKRAVRQRWYIGQLISEIQDKAKALYPESTSDRASYIQVEMDKIPSGQELQDKVETLDKVQFPLILEYFKDAINEGIPSDELQQLIYESSVEEMRTMIVYVLGGKKKSVSASEAKSGTASSGRSPKGQAISQRR